MMAVNGGKLTLATYNGRRYLIPDIWLAGFCTGGLGGHRRSIEDAVAWWAWQEELRERAEQAEILER